jgi:hypothetical protein
MAPETDHHAVRLNKRHYPDKQHQNTRSRFPESFRLLCPIQRHFRSTVYLEIKAAPVEEIWFLARKPVGSLQPGDILSTRAVW